MPKHREKVPLSQPDDPPTTSEPVDDESAAILGDELADPDELENSTQKKKTPRNRAWGWIGCFLLGTVVGGGGGIAAAMFGYIPTPSSGKGGGIPSSEKTLSQPRPQPQQTFVEVAEAMKRGDIEKAAKAGVESLPTTKPEELALRGKFRFRSYLQKQARAGVEVKADDAAVKDALADLEKAKTADAFLELAHIHTLTGDLDKAQKTLEDGLAQFKDDRFTIALTRVRFLKAKQDKKAERPGSVWRNGHDGWSVLVLTLLAGAPDAGPMPQPMGVDAWQAVEPGVKFSEALKLLMMGNYSDAIEALKEAKKRHEKFKNANPSEHQNQNSDPDDEIFIDSCNEIIDAWKALDLLKNDNYLPKLNQPSLAQALPAVLADARAGKAMGRISTKLIAAKLIDKPEDADKAIDALLAERKTDRNKLGTKLIDAKVITKLEDADKGIDDLLADRKARESLVKKLIDDKVITRPEDADKGIDTLLAERKTDRNKLGTKLIDAKVITKLEDADKGIDDLLADHKALVEAKKKLHDITMLLVTAKFLEKPDDARLVQGVRDAIQIAEMKNPMDANRKDKEELAGLKEQNKKVKEELAGLVDKHKKEIDNCTKERDQAKDLLEAEQLRSKDQRLRLGQERLTPLTKQALLTAEVPTDAKLFINKKEYQPYPGETIRQFLFPEFPTGPSAEYKVRIELVREGRPIKAEREVTLRSGQGTRLRFTEGGSGLDLLEPISLADRCLVVVEAPINMRLFVNGNPHSVTNQTRREIFTHALPAGKSESVVLRLESLRPEGRPGTITRRVVVQRGSVVCVSMMED